jgi:hypothetical protein
LFIYLLTLGGDGANGGNGGHGGNGADITVTVCVYFLSFSLQFLPKVTDPRVLIMLSANCCGGRGGSAGRAGKGGKAGSAGSLGDGGPGM